jgi:hypothetical protein
MVANVGLARGGALRARARAGTPGSWSLRACATALSIAVSAVATAGRAQLPAAPDPRVRATIVRIDGDDLVIDAGEGAISAGEELQVYRSLDVRHPLTHKLLHDRFVIATVRVEQVGVALSIVRVVAGPSHPVALGDAAETPHVASTPPVEPSAAPASANPQAIASAPATPPASAAPPARAQPADAETAALGRVWRATLEQPPERRAQLYMDHLRAFPRSPHREVLSREIDYLRNYAQSIATLEQRAQSVERGLPQDLAHSVALQAPENAAAGQALELAVAVRVAAPVRSLLLHVRPIDESGYRSQAMALDDNRHARATVPAALVRAPGLAYFIEAVGNDGTVVPAVGSVSEPRTVRVLAKGEAKAAPDALPGSRVRFSSELASFDGVSGRDYYLITEGDFLLRLRRGHLYGIRMGYGHYRGEGGTVQQLDMQKLEPASAGFTYGFFETELAINDLLGVAARGTVGLGRPENSSEQGQAVTGGFQLRVRVGAPEGTRLVLAGELLPEIGQRAFLALYWDVIERLPMAAEVQVTDQPVNSDELGVRLIYELGFEVTERLAIALRPSYQLRTIKHAGPGIGLAASFDW